MIGAVGLAFGKGQGQQAPAVGGVGRAHIRKPPLLQGQELARILAAHSLDHERAVLFEPPREELGRPALKRLEAVPEFRAGALELVGGNRCLCRRGAACGRVCNGHGSFSLADGGAILSPRRRAAYAGLTSILRAGPREGRSRVTVSTPCFMLAFTVSGSTPGGRGTRRTTEP